MVTKFLDNFCNYCWLTPENRCHQWEKYLINYMRVEPETSCAKIHTLTTRLFYFKTLKYTNIYFYDKNIICYFLLKNDLLFIHQFFSWSLIINNIFIFIFRFTTISIMKIMIKIISVNYLCINKVIIKLLHATTLCARLYNIILFISNIKYKLNYLF